MKKTLLYILIGLGAAAIGYVVVPTIEMFWWYHHPLPDHLTLPPRI